MVPLCINVLVLHLLLVFVHEILYERLVFEKGEECEDLSLKSEESEDFKKVKKVKFCVLKAKKVKMSTPDKGPQRGRNDQFCDGDRGP